MLTWVSRSVRDDGGDVLWLYVAKGNGRVNQFGV